MKKIVIAMLLLLPLIIVASVLLATSVIAHEVYIAVEGVELDVDSKKTLEIGLSAGSYQLGATVYPTGARNREVEWSVENVVCFGDEIADPVTIKDGLVTFKTYCAFDAVVTTVEGQKTARCNFYVKCDELTGLSFVAPSSVEVGARAELAASLDPADAEVYDVIWTSSDPAVLDVDKNGILTGRSVGTAIVKAEARGIECERTVTVTPSITKYGREISTARDTITFAELGVAEATALSGATVSDGRIALINDRAELSVGGGLLLITRCEDGIRIKNGDLLSQRTYLAGKTPLYIEAEYADDLREGTPDYSVSCGEETVPDGKVEFSEKGQFRVTVTDGSATQEGVFNVVSPVAYVRLDTVDADDKRGIANTTVYGTQSYGRDGIVGYQVPLHIQYPTDADWEDFDLTVSRPDLLEITDDHVVVVKRNVAESTVVTVSVTAHHSGFVTVPARANRHFTLVDGINCFTYDDVLRASSEDRAIVLRNNVRSKEGDAFIELNNDFFGNGYMLDVSDTDKEAEEAVVRVVGDDVLITNAYIRCDDGSKINTPNGLHGGAVWVGNDDAEYVEEFGYVKNARVEYSIMENCYYCAAVTRGEATFDGCIFRNASNFGIYLPNDRVAKPLRDADGFDSVYIHGDVTVNNCIVSNVIAPAVGISTFASEAGNTPLKEQSTFRQTGFFDVYNWQDITSDTMLGREFLPGNPQANSLFRTLITSYLSEELSKPEYSRICYHDEEHNFIHLGVITSGALNECTTVPTFEDPRFKIFPLTALDGYSGAASLFIGHELYRINVYLYEVDEAITPDTKFVADKVAFSRLRGEE